MKRVIFFALLIVFAIHLGWVTFSYKKEYEQKYNASYWKTRYLRSQWIDPLSRETIGDDGLYAYAGWEYVHGADPSFIAAEVPALGKYVIGLTILAFQNQNIFGLITGAFVLALFYWFNLLMFRDKLLAFIPVFFFSFEPLFTTQLRAPFLDLLYLSFLLLVFVFLLKKRYVFSSIFLACFAATKFPPSAVFPAGAIVLWLLVARDFSSLKKYAVSLVFVPLAYSLVYIRFFMLHPSFLEFLKFQKWVFTTYAHGAKASFGIIYPMIFGGQWKTWWDGVVHVSEWQITWPLVFLGSFLSLPFLLRRRREKKESAFLLTVIWILTYLAFLSMTPVYPRYLLLILPFLYNLSVWVLSESIRTKFIQR